MNSKQGLILWTKTDGIQKKCNSLVSVVNYGKWMKEWRLKIIRQYIPMIIEDPTIKENDDWYNFKRRVELFTQQNEQLYMVSSILILDKSISAFVPM